MAEPVRVPTHLADLDARVHAIEDALKGGGGGGISGGMEARIAKLESDMGYVKTDLSDLKSDIRVMRTDVSALKVDSGILAERVGNLPTKEWSFKTLAAMLASLAIIVGLIVRFMPHA